MGFTLFGIRTTVHNSFFFLAALIVFLNLPNLLFGLWITAVLFFCVIGHEYAHALDARRFGYNTRSITMYLFGGIAHIEGMSKPKPSEEISIASAGPAFNIILGILGFFAMNVLYTSLGFMSSYLAAFVAINFILGVFNLIPAYPMDGGRIFRSFLSKRMGHGKATEVASKVAMVFAGLFVFGGFALGEFMLPVVGVMIFLYNYGGGK